MRNLCNVSGKLVVLGIYALYDWDLFRVTGSSYQISSGTVPHCYCGASRMSEQLDDGHLCT